MATPALLDRPRVCEPLAADDATCVCGQALDCSHTRHCPRCGITVRR